MGASGAGEMPATGLLIGMIDNSLQVEDGAAAITSSENGTAVDLGAGHAPTPMRFVQLFADVTALDTGDADETYELELEESSDNLTYTATGLKFSVAATGEILKGVGITKRYVRLKKTLAGTTPSITFKAWIIPLAA